MDPATSGQPSLLLIPLYCYLVIATTALLIAAAMEYKGLKARISGANGFVWTMILVVLGKLLLVAAGVAWWLTSIREALWTFGAGACWLALWGWLSFKLMARGAPPRANP